MNGKGDSPRPMEVDREKYESNYDRIFNTDPERDAFNAINEACDFEEAQANLKEIVRNKNGKCNK